MQTAPKKLLSPGWKKSRPLPLLLRKFNFGKYRGRSIVRVPLQTAATCSKLLGQKLDSGENDENWIYTLRHYLGH
ncbi:MAG: hypothetical protein U1F40_06220 [Turneriella sp.]